MRVKSPALVSIQRDEVFQNMHDKGLGRFVAWRALASVHSHQDEPEIIRVEVFSIGENYVVEALDFLYWEFVGLTYDWRLSMYPQSLRFLWRLLRYGILG